MPKKKKCDKITLKKQKAFSKPFTPEEKREEI